MRFEPHHDRILIKPAPPETSRAGLELMSNDIQDKAEGTVIEIGTGVPLHNIKLEVTGEVTEAAMDKLIKVIELINKGREISYKPGDYVLYGRHAGTKVPINGEDFIMLREADVFGKLIDDGGSDQ